MNHTVFQSRNLRSYIQVMVAVSSLSLLCVLMVTRQQYVPDSNQYNTLDIRVNNRQLRNYNSKDTDFPIDNIDVSALSIISTHTFNHQSITNTKSNFIPNHSICNYFNVATKQGQFPMCLRGLGWISESIRGERGNGFHDCDVLPSLYAHMAKNLPLYVKKPNNSVVCQILRSL